MSRWVSEWILANTAGEGLIFDLGAGEGALSKRLADAGLNVLAADRSPEQWKVNSIRCARVDFDETVWASQLIENKIRAICMVECIEHTANPRDVLSNVCQLVRAHRVPALVTTPNPLDTFSCIQMFRRGEFGWFSPRHYPSGGHISILPHWLIEEHCRYLGGVSTSHHFICPYRHPRFVQRTALRILSRGCGEFADGQVAVTIIRPEL